MSGALPAIAVVSTPALSGCAVVTAAGAAASTGATVFGGGVEVAPGTVKVDGKASGTAVPVISEPADPPPAPAEEPKWQQ